MELSDKGMNSNFILHAANVWGKETFMNFYLGKYKIEKRAFVRRKDEWVIKACYAPYLDEIQGRGITNVEEIFTSFLEVARNKSSKNIKGDELFRPV